MNKRKKNHIAKDCSDGQPDVNVKDGSTTLLTTLHQSLVAGEKSADQLIGYSTSGVLNMCATIIPSFQHVKMVLDALM